jgi:transcriptional regulator
MYPLTYFKEPDRQRLLDFMKAHPFVLLLGCSKKGMPVATHIPVLVEEHGQELWVYGHMMRNTDHHKALLENSNALIVFQGPHCYVSATWYSQQQMASTWNYMTVHVQGEIEFLPDEQFQALMKKFSLHFENENPESAVIYDNLPEAFVQKMMPAITGFKLKAEKLDNVFKLSQNRDLQSYENIIQQLEKKDENSKRIAAEMKLRKFELFPPGKPWNSNRFDS